MAASATAQPLYLVKLTPELTAIGIMIIARLPAIPKVHHDENDSTISFAEVDAATREIIRWFLGPKKGLFIPLPAPSAKQLEGALGLGHKMMVIPGQNQYPVPYFFYGALANSDKLVDVVGMPETPNLVDAVVRGGTVKLWRGKCRALVDNDNGLVGVVGKMYVVKNREEEDALRLHEGANYEVVRCKIEAITGEVCYGLTFRFCGDEEGLVDLEQYSSAQGLL